MHIRKVETASNNGAHIYYELFLVKIGTRVRHVAVHFAPDVAHHSQLGDVAARGEYGMCGGEQPFRARPVFRIRPPRVLRHRVTGVVVGDTQGDDDFILPRVLFRDSGNTEDAACGY